MMPTMKNDTCRLMESQQSNVVFQLNIGFEAYKVYLKGSLEAVKIPKSQHLSCQHTRAGTV